MAEESLIEQLAEVASESQFRIKSSTVKVDHEKEEKTLSVVFVQGDPRQANLPMGGAEAGRKEEEEEG